MTGRGPRAAGAVVPSCSAGAAATGANVSNAGSGANDSNSRENDGLIKSETFTKDRKRYYLDLKENQRGRFLRVSYSLI